MSCDAAVWRYDVSTRDFLIVLEKTFSIFGVLLDEQDKPFFFQFFSFFRFFDFFKLIFLRTGILEGLTEGGVRWKIKCFLADSGGEAS